MKKLAKSVTILSLFFIIFLFTPGVTMATFSIVAVDTVTGAVGGAGASCIAGSQMINDVVEGIGAIHTQAYYLVGNQQNAHDLLVSGLDPDSIISWLYWNDVNGEPEYRQYLVATLDGPGASSAFTGTLTSYYKGHLYGPGYAIAGNILLGPEIIEDMETAYLAAEGPLEEKLMAAMEAANVPGADSRCLTCQKPAISAFIHVVQPGDGTDHYLDLVVNNTICDVNPMDTLLAMYDSWKALRYADADLSTVEIDKQIIPANCPDTAIITVTPLNHASEIPFFGVDEVLLTNIGSGILSTVADNGDGSYAATVYAGTEAETDTITAFVAAGGETTELNQKAIITYFASGDADGNNSVNILDITYLISYLYKGGNAPDPLERGDVNSSGSVNILDITYIISYLYKDGPAPQCP